MSTDEQYYRERAYIDAERLDQERSLWQWINENDPTPIIDYNIVKAEPISSNKLYLYRDSEDLEVNLNI